MPQTTHYFIPVLKALNKIGTIFVIVFKKTLTTNNMKQFIIYLTITLISLSSFSQKSGMHFGSSHATTSHSYGSSKSHFSVSKGKSSRSMGHSSHSYSRSSRSTTSIRSRYVRKGSTGSSRSYGGSLTSAGKSNSYGSYGRSTFSRSSYTTPSFGSRNSAKKSTGFQLGQKSTKTTKSFGQ